MATTTKTRKTVKTSKIQQPRRTKNQIREDLRQSAAIVRANAGAKSEYRFGSYYELVLKYGQHFKPQPLPKHIRRGKMGDCYMNAFRISGPPKFGGKGLIYCEGYATSGLAVIEHAWCVDPKTGCVIDPTWTDGTEYFGVPFDHIFVCKTILRKGTSSVFWDRDNPLLKRGIPKSALHRISRCRQLVPLDPTGARSRTTDAANLVRVFTNRKSRKNLKDQKIAA